MESARGAKQVHPATSTEPTLTLRTVFPPEAGVFPTNWRMAKWAITPTSSRRAFNFTCPRTRSFGSHCGRGGVQKVPESKPRFRIGRRDVDPPAVAAMVWSMAATSTDKIATNCRYGRGRHQHLAHSARLSAVQDRSHLSQDGDLRAWDQFPGKELADLLGSLSEFRVPR